MGYAYAPSILPWLGVHLNSRAVRYHQERILGMEKSENNWHAQETYRSMMEFARGMLRFTFLANGGAIIALLTFLGDLYS